MNAGQGLLLWSRWILFVAALLGSSLACGLEEPAPGAVTLADCYQVTFLGMMRSTERITTWRYRVEQACPQSLSNWMLELPPCASVVDASSSAWESVQPDPEYQFSGVKWQTGAGFERGEFSVVLSGELEPGTVRAGVKGPGVAVGQIAGPACTVYMLILTPTVATLTPSMTAVPTLSPMSVLPTETPVILQPPAAIAEPILITESQQSLTFTCRDHAVEVHGNANVIVLLGSCSSITVYGSGNQVYWQAGAPFITNTGNDNIIQRR